MTEEAFLREVCLEAEKIYWQPILDEIASGPVVDIQAESDKRTINYIHKLEKKYLHNRRNPSNSFSSKRGLKALLIAAILIFLLSVSTFSFNPIKEFFKKIYTDCTEIVFSTFKSNNDFLYAEYSFIPNGYKLLSNKKSELGQELVFYDNKKYITITTNISKYSSVFIDTENANTGLTTINDCEAYYSITERSIILAWSSGKYNHCITANLNGNIITLDSVKRIAESRIQEK